MIFSNWGATRLRAAFLAAAVGVLTLVPLSAGVAQAAPPVGPPTGATVVGSPGPDCPAPAFPTITLAVVAALPGGTIYVCNGTYNETVVVPKSLTILGAQRGVDARKGRTDPAAESVVTAPIGSAFTVVGPTTVVTIDGFTLSGSPGNGIDAFNGSAGHSFVNNVFVNNANGMNINSNGSAPTTVSHNRFTTNNAVPADAGGSGVLVTSGPGSDLTVEKNLFSGHTSAAFNHIGDPNPANRSTGLVVRDNESIDDSSMVVINNADGALIEDNESTKAANLTGTAIFIVGNTDGLVVRGNELTGGAGVGISANAAFGSAASTNLTIEKNLIKERSTGIRIGDGHDATTTVRSNRVFDSNGTDPDTGYGLRMLAGTNGVQVTDNVALRSANFDCRDESVGAGTAGTANTWLGDTGRSSSPDGLCAPPRDDDGDHHGDGDKKSHKSDKKSKDDDHTSGGGQVKVYPKGGVDTGGFAR